MANYDVVFPNVIAQEGGYGNIASDSGNYCDGNLVGTKYGISAVAYKGYYGKCPSVSDMKNLTLEQAKAIWKWGFWDKINGDSIDSNGIAELIFHSVGGGATGFLHTRQAINKTAGKSVVTESNKSPLTQKEVALINSFDSKVFFKNLYDIRYNFFQNNSKSSIFGAGWINALNKTYNNFLSAYKSGLDVVKKNKGTAAVIVIAGAMIIYYLYLVKNNKI